MPTLVIDGKALTQSLAIIEYLAEVQPECGVLPADIADRQKVRPFAYAVAMDIHPICNTHVVALSYMTVADKTDAREEWMKHFITDGLRQAGSIDRPSRQRRFSFEDVHRRWRT